MAMRIATESYLADDGAPASPSRAGGVHAATAATVAIAAWNPHTPYLTRINSAAPADRYAAYLDQAKTHATAPGFFLDCADHFLQQNDTALGLRILSNLAEFRLEDPALLRVYAWRLQQAGDLDRAITLLRRVTRLRPEDPQSWRDLALALAERGKAELGRAVSPKPPDGSASRPYQDLEKAQALLLKVILTPWNRTAEIELFALEDLNALIAWLERVEWPEKPAIIDLDPRLRKNLDLDLRVVMSWDADATDVDLHVIEPSGEEAYYGRNRTTIRGHVTHDITDGYGPEAYLLRAAPAGTYTIRAKYFGSRQQTLMGPATVTARVFTNWGRENESSQTLTLRLDTVRDMVEIGKIAMGGASAWVSSDLVGMKLRTGMTEAEIETLLGKPARVEGGAWFYLAGARNWKFVFEDEKLLRVSELLPGNAEMIIVQ
jgi:tetratricopeptide (TPR) repeat protein